MLVRVDLSLLKIFIFVCWGNQEELAKESRRQHRVPWAWVQAVVSPLVLVLGTELRSFGRVDSTINP